MFKDLKEDDVMNGRVQPPTGTGVTACVSATTAATGRIFCRLLLTPITTRRLWTGYPPIRVSMEIETLVVKRTFSVTFVEVLARLLAAITALTVTIAALVTSCTYKYNTSSYNFNIKACVCLCINAFVCERENILHHFYSKLPNK